MISRVSESDFGAIRRVEKEGSEEEKRDDREKETGDPPLVHKLH